MSVQPEAVGAGGVTPPAATSQTADARAATVRVWDPFVRIFHWSLVALFILAFVTGDEIERLHVAAGYMIAALVVLRIVWGLVGPHHARFRGFVRLPAETFDYMSKAARGRAPRYIGHNPAGGLMTIVLLGMIVAIAGSGFLMTTDAFWGAKWVETLHKGLVYTTLGLIALHVAGVIATSVSHRENLVKAMITGRKRA